MIIVAGYLEVDPDERAAYLEATFDVARLARAFPGCLDFGQFADPLAPDRIVVYERWDSDEALLAFRSSGPDDEGTGDGADADLPELRGAAVAKYRISAVESP